MFYEKQSSQLRNRRHFRHLTGCLLQRPKVISFPSPILLSAYSTSFLIFSIKLSSTTPSNHVTLIVNGPPATLATLKLIAGPVPIPDWENINLSILHRPSGCSFFSPPRFETSYVSERGLPILAVNIL